MSDNEAVHADNGQEARIMRKVVFTYRLEGDPEDVERTWTLEHGGDGEVIDGIIWNGALMKKLAYQEQDTCREVEKRPGKGAWKRSSGRAAAQQRQVSAPESEKAARADTSTRSSSGDCIWFHDVNCVWWEYCRDSPT